jgi:hypothetical protein
MYSLGSCLQFIYYLRTVRESVYSSGLYIYSSGIPFTVQGSFGVFTVEDSYLKYMENFIRQDCMFLTVNRWSLKTTNPCSSGTIHRSVQSVWTVFLIGFQKYYRHSSGLVNKFTSRRLYFVILLLIQRLCFELLN